MKKTWIEKHIYTVNEQIAIIQPNETMDGIILQSKEIEDNSNFRLYLSYKEAIDLAKLLEEYALANTGA